MHDTEGGGTPRGVRRWFPAAEPDHRYPRVTSARVLAALFDVLVGLRLLWPDDSLGSSPGYALAHAHFLGDAYLGGGLVAMGVVMAASLYADRLQEAAGVVTVLAMATWGLFALDLLITNGSQIGTFAYGIPVAGGHAYALAHLLFYRDQQRRGTIAGRAT